MRAIIADTAKAFIGASYALAPQKLLSLARENCTKRTKARARGSESVLSFTTSGHRATLQQTSSLSTLLLLAYKYGLRNINAI